MFLMWKPHMLLVTANISAAAQGLSIGQPLCTAGQGGNYSTSVRIVVGAKTVSTVENQTEEHHVGVDSK